MSFFGFDTSLPRDRKDDKPLSAFGGGSGGGGALDDEELDAKIRGLTAGAQEDVQIYEWGGEGYDGLGDMLDEAGDDFNADTFGADLDDIGKDFDFGHGGAASSAPAAAKPASRANDSKFASNFDDFWALPSMTKAAAPPPPAPTQQQQQQPPARAAKTMEEIEAELRASRISQPQPQQQAQSQGPPASSSPAPGRRPMTMEEIEAEMRGARQAQPPQQQQQQQQPPMPMPSGPGAPFGAPAPFASPMPPPMAAPGLPPQPVAAPPTGPRNNAADFPPLGTRPPVPMPPTGPARGTPPAAAAMQQSHASMQAQQAEHFARMQAMLRALPEPVQQGITTLPPQMHFDILEGIGREFAVLLQPAATDEDREVQARATTAALARLRGVHRFEQKRLAREAKIAAMSRYNNLMSVSDKEFITRIQISQILPNDPYAEDFYAHIYFALRGRPGPNPGLMGAAPQAPQQGQQGKQPPKGPKKMNAQQKAMLRMQQQVERLVADRKSRIEKAAQGTVNPNLEGALGKVGLNVAGNPRQALQIGKQQGQRSGDERGATTAADVVRQALEGASLDKNSGAAAATMSADGKRPPLTRHQALRILEELYDTVLALEQLRRSADSGDAGARAEQEALTATLWKELRVLEPLEISDPHPFVSLLNTTKGKRLFPRALRHLSSEQTLTALTMIVASFDSLDVVRNAAVLDDERSIGSEARREMETQTDVFSNTIVPAMLGLMATSPFKIVIGMLALFVERNDVVLVARSRAGIAFLTILLSRAEALRHGGSSQGAPAPDGTSTSPPPPSAEEQDQWKQIFRLLFERLVTRTGSLASLLPSSRAKAAHPFGSLYSTSSYGGIDSLDRQRRLDESDEPAWNLFAALAVSASMEEQSVLVQELREKILENVLEARSKGGSVEMEMAGRRKLRLVNIFLNALGLDASQITV